MQRYRFQRQIIIKNIIVVVVVILMLTIGAFGYICWNYTESYKEQQEFQIAGIRSQISSALDLADEIALQLAANQTLILAFKEVGNYSGERNYFVEDTDLEYRLKQYMMSYMLKQNSIGRICLFDDRQNFTFAGRAVDYGYLQKNCPDQQIFLETSKWFENGEGTSMFRIDESDPFVQDGDMVISVTREIKDYQLLPSERLGYVQLQIPVSNFAKFCEGLGGDSTFFLSYGDTVVFAYNSGEEPVEITSATRVGREGAEWNVFRSQSHMEEYGFTLEIVSKNVRLINTITTTLVWLAILVVCVILIIWFGQMQVIRKTTEPIGRLCDMVENLHADENLKKIPLIDAEEGDELRKLNLAFDGVVRNLKLSMEKTMISRVNEVRSQMLALQAQMNPHFIHNILTIISAMANTDECSRIPVICEKLSDMIRYNTNYEDNYTDLSKEINYAENYLELMKLRYEENLIYSMACIGQMQDCEVPRFIIQPLLENSFYHGFQKIEFPWKIDIKIFATEEKWECVVTDNGCGIPAEKQEEIRRELEKSREQSFEELTENLKIGGLTIRNIYIRLYMAYKDRMIFDIENREQGTCIKIGGVCNDKSHGGG